MHIEVECPRCAGTMVKRTNKKNGNTFYGCDNYPNCRQTMTERSYTHAYQMKGYEVVGETPPGYEAWEDMGDF